jgi:hypothetical protein
MIIVRLLSPSLLVGFGTTKVYSGVGADIVMESIALTIRFRVLWYSMRRPIGIKLVLGFC